MKPSTETSQQFFSFTLVLSGLGALTDEVLDALFEAGCDDSLPVMRDGVVRLDFDRQAASFRDALVSAMDNVERAGVGAQVVRVEPIE